MQINSHLNVQTKAVTIRNFWVYKKHAYWAATAKNNFPLNPTSDFAVTIASYPKRIHLIPAVFESLARQSILPKYAYLVLSECDFPHRKVPSYISKLEDRGVIIVWTQQNTFAVKKLVPILDICPDLGIITYDDDMIYEPHCSSIVLKHRVKGEKLVIGQIGSNLYRKGSSLSLFQRSGKANINSPSSNVYLQGCGTYYDALALHALVTDFSAISKIVPGRGSDIWFWAAAKAAGTRQICAHTPENKRIWTPIPQTSRTVPKERPGRDVLEQRFQSTIDFFDIREQLLKELPDHRDIEL